MTPSRYFISAYYKFVPLTNLEDHRQALLDKAVELGVRGIFILGPEGINSTCSAPSALARSSWETWLESRFAPGITFKHAEADQVPFRRFIVKIRPEIVTAGRPDLQASDGPNHHLTPAEWNRVLKEENDWVMLDTRNWYEYEMGTFAGALNPQTDKFTDFFDQVDSLNLPKDKKLLIFCTGGIRCHKGILELQDRGYSNVWQLEGGILKYLEEFPDDQFKGECFVFDHRVAVDQQLRPTTRYGLCPHCGNPAAEKITCVRCDHSTLICSECAGHDTRKLTCSKNCHHHYLKHPGRKAKHQFRAYEIERMQG